MSTLMNTAIKLGKFDSNPNIERFTSIYYFFKNTFGKRLCRRYFRTIQRYICLCRSYISCSSLRSKMVTEAFIKKSSSKFILFFALFFLPFFLFSLSFFQANFHIENIDVPDVLAFSIVPISIAIFVTYPLLRNFILTKMQGNDYAYSYRNIGDNEFYIYIDGEPAMAYFWQGAG